MSDFGQRVIERLTKHLEEKFPEQSETRCRDFAESLERYEDRVQQQITRSLVRRFNFKVTASLEAFAKGLVSGAIRKWSRRPWMRPPTQTGRRKCMISVESR